MSLNATKATAVSKFLSTDAGSSSVRGKVQVRVFDGQGKEVDIGDVFSQEFTGEDGIIWNQTLETAKKVFSRLAAGQSAYKIGKIAFGNSGHDFTNPKQAVAATSTDEELLSITRIKSSLNDADPDKHFIYQDGGGTNHRMVYIEKDILSSHITFGPNDNQLIINVPISYAEFNAREGDATTNDVAFQTPLISYRTINPNDGTIMTFGNVDGAGVPVEDFTEVHSWDDNGTQRYTFKNGLTTAGAINTTDGGDRPQELSEILLSTDIVGAGTAEDPYEKLATSRMTSGLLNFPEDFNFVYSWTLSWDFS
jgi:hypothetical protein